MFVQITSVSAAIQTQEVDYKANGTVLKGYLAYDDSIKQKRPGIIVVHEWWGHNEYVRQRADMLAKLGYTALAIDMYGEGKKADHPKDAGAFSKAAMKNLSVAEARFKAAVDILKAHKTTDSKQIAAIGYCFGGGVVLEMMRRSVDLAGVVSFHGSLKTQHKGNITTKTKVLVCNGADDPFVTAEQISSFKAEMQSSNVDYKFKNYAGAKHAFTNPAATELGKKFNIPLAYNKNADKQSWKDMQAFFDSLFN